MKIRLITTLAIVLMLTATLSLPAVAADEQSVDASVTVTAPEDYISISVSDQNSDGIQFGPVAPSNAVVYGDEAQEDGTPAVTVTVAPETNVQVDISIKGSTPDELALGITNWKYSKLFDKSDIASLTGSYVEVYDNKGPGPYDFYHWISVPVGTAATDYSATISYKAEKHT